VDDDRTVRERRDVPASDQYSLALGRAVARHLQADSKRVRAIGRRNLARVRSEYVSEPFWLRRWQELLEGPEEALVDVLTSPAEEARVLRQSSPFAGVLTPRERWRLLRQVREARRAARSA
jgi:hypothetical protein